MHLMGLWLALFSAKASKVFLGLRFDFPAPAEDELRESESNGEDDLRVSSAAPRSAFFVGDPKVQAARPPSSDT